MLRNWRRSVEKEKVADMVNERDVALGEEETEHWDASDQSLLSATLLATPAQRLAWLEEALQ